MVGRVQPDYGHDACDYGGDNITGVLVNKVYTTTIYNQPSILWTGLEKPIQVAQDWGLFWVYLIGLCHPLYTLRAQKKCLQEDRMLNLEMLSSYMKTFTQTLQKN